MSDLSKALAAVGESAPERPTWIDERPELTVFVAGAESSFGLSRRYALSLESLALRLAVRLAEAERCRSCEGKGEIDMVTGWKDNGPNEPIEIVEAGTCPGCDGTGKEQPR